MISGQMCAVVELTRIAALDGNGGLQSACVLCVSVFSALVILFRFSREQREGKSRVLFIGRAFRFPLQPNMVKSIISSSVS